MQPFAYVAPDATEDEGFLPEMSPTRRRLVIAGLITAGLLFLGGFVLSGYVWSLSRRFPSAPFAQPSRLYGTATPLATGEALSAAEMVAELDAAGYRETDDAEAANPLPLGSWRRTGDRVAVHLRRFPTPEGQAGGRIVEVDFRGDRIAAVREAGAPVRSTTLEPPLLASYYGRKVEERRPVSLKELPQTVVKAVLAAEDSGFYLHPGVSPTGIARALWKDVKGGEVEQGGSTITQQLVKNVYLSNRRTLSRKAKEAFLAMAVELRYGKRAILEAYLNEIYLGQSGPANVIGLGAAARAWFGKDAAELTLAEAATLAGMIQGPGDTSPVEHPDRARERRDWVLHRMGELRWISKEQLAQALAEPLAPHPETVKARPLAPYFADAAEAEAKERFGLQALGSRGYLLFSTVSWRDQVQAEAAVDQGLQKLEAGWEKSRRRGKALQAALISVDPRDGAIRAWVGGRDYGASQFDRVSQARRQAGSAFKPVVYAAAFAGGVAMPATVFSDSPITVRMGTASWSPQNYDHGFRGWVTARMALEQSLNVPTVRIALQVGMDHVAELARSLGIAGHLDPVPAAALGTFEVSPLEMATVYSTFADAGMRPPVHALAAVLDPQGEPVNGDELPAPLRVMPADAAYLVTNILQGVIDHGTAAAARSLGVTGPLAGKTGTTNDQRDSWFAGYSPERATVVWVGYDDNSSSHLTGARAALPIWGRFTAAVRPAGGYTDFPMPAGMVRATVDPVTGQLATPYCPTQVTDLFPEWKAPTVSCERHTPGYNGDALADVTLSQPSGDPAASEELGTSVTTTADGLEIVRPVAAVAAATPGGGTIVIRPSQPRPNLPVAGATGGPAGMAPVASVVPPGSGPIGAKTAPPPPPEPADEAPPP
ncbi:MAG TPA: PBP1A family penicillin-binding protein [Thermoanaerobaculia bacterium]|nr:PBP1A family penicillin-binding protein [Thermoanaerobaculia bacterium]